MATIELVNVSKTYSTGGGVHALRNVSLTIRENDYVGIVGPSGSGKSTLLHLIGLLDTPTDGRVMFEGKNTSDLSDADLSRLRGREIGFVFQSFHMIPHLSVVENVELPLFYQGVGPRQRRQRAETALESVNLLARKTHLPRQLSGGEGQRAAIARALVTNPSLILADEPTGNLDSRNGAEILAVFEDLHGRGKTLVVITHDLSIAQRIPRNVRVSDGAISGDVGR